MLALIAGRGALPELVVDAQGSQPLICALTGTAPDTLTPDLTFRLETLGTLLIELGTRGVTQVCFAGAIDRPALDPTKLDAETAPLVPLFMAALQKGDDGALRGVVEIFEKTGFEVKGAHELAPDLLAKPGVLSHAWPDAQMRRNAEVGAAHITDLGPHDIGQACVVAGARVMAMEDQHGTDALVGRVAAKGQSAILFKGPKPDQSRLIDLPTIGPATVEAAGIAGLVGVVVDADDVLLLYPDECAEIANKYGLVIWARTGS